MDWNKYQLAIFEAIKAWVFSAMVIIARAGTGKTSTMLAALSHVPQNGGKDGKPTRVLFVAFNRDIAAEILEKVQALDLPGLTVDVKTLHSHGFAALRKAWKTVKVDNDKVRDIARNVAAKAYSKPADAKRCATLLRMMVSRAKNEGVDPSDTKWAKRAMTSAGWAVRVFDDAEWTPKKLVPLALDVLAQNNEDTSRIDFDDMVYLPMIHKAYPWGYDLVIVDEAQDMNVCQAWLARYSRNKGGKLIAVGDDKQAIYGWRGAQEDALAAFAKGLSADVLTLPETFRCPKSVVRHVTDIVPDYTATEDAPEGEVRSVDIDEMLGQCAPGDYVISRTNAPLMAHCLSLLRIGKRATIRGKDIGKGLAALVEESQAGDIPSLLAWVEEWYAQEIEKAEKIPDEEDRAIFLAPSEDKRACLSVLAPQAASVADLLVTLADLFTDRVSAQNVTLMTAHRSKGLETRRVWLLAETFREEQDGEEANVYYVACTRAQETLCLVYDGTSESTVEQ